MLREWIRMFNGGINEFYHSGGRILNDVPLTFRRLMSTIVDVQHR
jgi:hypothetical protein